VSTEQEPQTAAPAAAPETVQITQDERLDGVALDYNPELKRAELHAPPGQPVDIASARALAGVAGVVLPPQYEKAWDTNAEGHALGLMVSEGIAPTICQSLLEWAADAHIVYGLNSRTGEQAFRAKFDGKLTRAQQDKLLAFYRTHVEREGA